MTTERIREGLICELVKRVHENGIDLGRTKLQKLEYHFQLRHYGPYSEELTREDDTLISLGFKRMESDPDGFGFHI